MRMSYYDPMPEDNDAPLLPVLVALTGAAVVVLLALGGLLWWVVR
jgi:hypothetical protein